MGLAQQAVPPRTQTRKRTAVLTIGSSRVRAWSRWLTGVRREAILAAVLGVMVSGCDPQVALHGLVTDINGEPLPGVAVKVSGTEAFAISNGTGIYGTLPNRLTVPPGQWQLRFIKTGFTTAELDVTTGDGRDYEVPAVALWPLPAARGIYTFSDNRYAPWTRVEPERFLRADRSPLFGTQLSPELSVDLPIGRIIGHKLPPYDWRMSRLEEQPVLRDGVDASRVSEDEANRLIWAESVRIGVQAVPLDEPERMLWEIRPARELGPGIYAVHWGALEGDPATEASAYLIEVVDPDAREGEDADEGEGEGDGDGEGTGEATAADRDGAAPQDN